MLADLLIIGITIAAGWRGAGRGLLRSLAGLGGSLAGIVAAIVAYRTTGSAAAGLGAMLIVTLGAYTLANLLTRMLRLSVLGTLNTVGGALIGAGWALAWLAVAIIGLRVAPVENELTRSLEVSTFADAVLEVESTLVRRDGLTRWLADLFGNPATIKLRATVDFANLPSAERELFEMANASRRAEGIPPLRWDPDLADAGRAYAADLYRRGSLTHEGADGSTPGERLKARGISYRRTGENLALALTTALVHEKLMASPKHRAHLLDRRFTRIGIGVMHGDQGLLVAQEFAA